MLLRPIEPKILCFLYLRCGYCAYTPCYYIHSHLYSMRGMRAFYVIIALGLLSSFFYPPGSSHDGILPEGNISYLFITQHIHYTIQSVVICVHIIYIYLYANKGRWKHRMALQSLNEERIEYKNRIHIDVYGKMRYLTVRALRIHGINKYRQCTSLYVL